MATIRKKYPRGTTVTITATPKQGKRFDHWYAQTGTPFKGGTSPMSTENPVQITMNSKYRIQAFFETIPSSTNSSTPTSDSPTRDNNVNFNRMESNEDFVNFFRFYEPFPGYDVRMFQSEGIEGTQPYYYEGNNTTGQIVEGRAKGIAFTPYLRNAISGYRLESSFYSNEPEYQTLQIGFTSNEEPSGTTSNDRGSIKSVLNGHLHRSRLTEKWQLDRQQVRLVIQPDSGNLRSFVNSLDDKTYVGTLDVTLYYDTISASNTVKYHTKVAIVVDERQNPPIEEYNNEGAEIVINLKHLWNKYDGFYLNGNLEAEPNSANYNN